MSEFSRSEKPREKIMSCGAESLSTVELVAVLLRTGMKGANVLDVARMLLRQAGDSLICLGQFSPQRMCAVGGIGPDKAATVAAAMELARRAACENDGEGSPVINTPDQAYELFRSRFTTQEREQCWCLLLKRSRRVIDCVRISEGGKSMTEIDIAAVVRRALDTGACSVILSHNHPTGNPQPSAADIKLTEKLRRALSTFELSLMDHIIIGENGYYSFSEERSFSK